MRRSTVDPEHRLAITGDERGIYSVELWPRRHADEGHLPRHRARPLSRACCGRASRSTRPERIFILAGVVGCGSLVARFFSPGQLHREDHAVARHSSAPGPPTIPTNSRSSMTRASSTPIRAMPNVSAARRSMNRCPSGAAVATSYRPGTEWAPEPLSRADGAPALLGNAVTALYRPAEAMQVITRAVEGGPPPGGRSRRGRPARAPSPGRARGPSRLTMDAGGAAGRPAEGGGLRPRHRHLALDRDAARRGSPGRGPDGRLSGPKTRSRAPARDLLARRNRFACASAEAPSTPSHSPT